MQNIVDSKSMGEVDGMPIDIQTANLFIKVYNRLQKEANRERLMNGPIMVVYKTIWGVQAVRPS
jgi:hypothetical protein